MEHQKTDRSSTLNDAVALLGICVSVAVKPRIRIVFVTSTELSALEMDGRSDGGGGGGGGGGGRGGGGRERNRLDWRVGIWRNHLGREENKAEMKPARNKEMDGCMEKQEGNKKIGKE